MRLIDGAIDLTCFDLTLNTSAEYVGLCFGWTFPDANLSWTHAGSAPGRQPPIRPFADQRIIRNLGRRRGRNEDSDWRRWREQSTLRRYVF